MIGMEVSDDLISSLELLKAAGNLAHLEALQVILFHVSNHDVEVILLAIAAIDAAGVGARHVCPQDVSRQFSQVAVATTASWVQALVRSGRRARQVDSHVLAAGKVAVEVLFRVEGGTQAAAKGCVPRPAPQDALADGTLLEVLHRGSSRPAARPPWAGVAVR